MAYYALAHEITFKVVEILTGIINFLEYASLSPNIMFLTYFVRFHPMKKYHNLNGIK